MANSIHSAIATWKDNGRVNNLDTDAEASVLDPLESDMYDGLYEFGIRSPGVVKIPVCDADDSWDGWGGASHEGNFPCP